ncbi:single-stranded-DNA-specific exonuclease RecJ [uncultured Rhodospira sp.]|uniref:single-stranded-DNA-specific exonuclease RecJ n=1 Tax=uncultured Rhodospira sp. TaxID=1936189 RepID=UPI00262A87A7|nr:single-stranded-DNA-specific exonuclease RecJ [uncultured Rhodospira sp.]
MNGGPVLEAAPLLGVERSVLGRRWRLRDIDERLATALTQRFDLPEVVARVLAGRGVTLKTAQGFLSPTMREQLPDPSHLRDMDAAVVRLVAAVRDGETIAVFGDYDVDGATSAAVLRRYLEAAGATVLVHIPDRLEEGYGPNAPALLALKGQGAGVCVCVDCGMTAYDPLAAARDAGLDVIVVDHHEAGEALPPAVAVINPKRRDETTPHTHLAAVGVTFLLVVGLNRALRESGWYTARPEPDLMALLDLVALGTVCDVVPLTGLNRAFVTQGLRIMARRGNPGLVALADVARLAEAPTAYHLGYVLGPRINAGGRVGEASMGMRLLSTADPDEARRLAEALDAFNGDRQEIEAQVLLEAIEQVEGAREAVDGPLVMAVGEGWHPGVVGIVASRLKDRYDLPACVVAVEGGQAKGSGRSSVPGLDLGSAVIAAREAGLLTLGGGHAMAAGFSLHPDRIEAFRAFVAARLSEQAGDGGLPDPCLDLDGTLAVEGAGGALLDQLEHVAPYGAGNPEPVFAVTGARLLFADVVGSGHVRCQLGGQGGGRLKGIAFRAADGELGQALLRASGSVVHVAGTIRMDRWQGQARPQIVISDMTLAG